MALTITAYRAAFSRCISCAEKQMGLRAIRNIAALGGRNPAYEAEQAARLPGLLAMAKARTERGL